MKKLSLLLYALLLLLPQFSQAYYDPTTGTWISRDPLGEAGGVNLYAFCNNDPVNNIDPTGLETISTDSAATILRLLRNQDSVTWHQRLLLLADIEESWLSYQTNPADVFVGSIGADVTRMYSVFTPSGAQAAHAAGVEKTESVMAESMVNGDSLFVAWMNGFSYNLGNFIGYTPVMKGGFGADVGTEEFLVTREVSMIPTGERWRLGVQGGASMFLTGTSLYGTLAPPASGMRSLQLAPDDLMMVRQTASKGLDQIRTFQLRRITSRTVRDVDQAIASGNASALERMGGSAGDIRMVLLGLDNGRFRGNIIDAVAKARASGTILLRRLSYATRFRYGPDIRNPFTGNAWDITTVREWSAHVRQYITNPPPYRPTWRRLYPLTYE